LTPPYKLKLLPTTVSFTIANSPNPDGSIDITVNKKEAAVSLYVTFTTLAAGRFSTNAFALVAPTRVITFIPFGELDIKTLTSSLRVEHVNMYI